MYHPDGSQFLTCGTDRKLTWWDSVEATPIRIIEGSTTHSVSALDITSDGEYFATGSQDCSVRVYNYDSGICLNVGYGHSSPVTRVAISPDTSFLVSASTDGSIMVWRFPITQLQGQVNETVVLARAPITSKSKFSEEQKEDLRSSPSSASSQSRVVKKSASASSNKNKLQPRMNPTIHTVNRNGSVRK